MSIWATIGDIEIPGRDDYTGELVTDDRARAWAPSAIDVATATSWNDCIRLSMYSEFKGADVMLTIDEARTLIDLMQNAIERIAVNHVIGVPPGRVLRFLKDSGLLNTAERLLDGSESRGAPVSADVALKEIDRIANSE